MKSSILAPLAISIALLVLMSSVAYGVATSGVSKPDAAKQTQEALEATPTPMPPVGPECPVDPRACDFATRAVDAFRSGRFDVVIASATASQHRCPGGDSAVKQVGLCEDSPGEEITGYPTNGGGLSLPVYVTLAELRDYIEAAIQDMGTGEYVVRSIGCPVGNRGSRLQCDEVFLVTVGPREPTPTSVALVLIAGLVDGGQTSLIGAGRITPAHNQAPVNGGTANLNFVPGLSVFSFVTWRP